MSRRLKLICAAVLCFALAACDSFENITHFPKDPLPAHPEQGPFLFCYFLGNGDGLHLAESADGLAFTPIGGRDKKFLIPEIGANIDGSEKDNHLMRDPCIRQGEDGMYHMVWTTGWYQKGFGAASSPDLIHWSNQQYIAAMNWAPVVVNTWAPELFHDDQDKEWMVLWASTVPGKFPDTDPPAGAGKQIPLNGESHGLNHRIYYTTTKNFKDWAPTKLLYDPGFSCIDATIAKTPKGKYVMVLKDETAYPAPKKNLRVATADSPQGPWSAAGEPISPPGLWVEGPSVARVGDGWNVYFDIYRNGTYGAMRTSDFKHFQPAPGSFSTPRGSRHGTVFPVGEAVIERLKRNAVE